MAREAAKEMAAGKEPDPELPVTVGDATARYLAWFAENRKALRETTTTINAYILPTFGERALASLTSAELKTWLQKLATKPTRVRNGMGAKQQYCAKPENDHQKRARKSTANRILTVLKAIIGAGNAQPLRQKRVTGSSAFSNGRTRRHAVSLVTSSSSKPCSGATCLERANSRH